MATLKQIKGTAIQFLDADPVQYVGTWASGGSVNTGRRYTAGLGSTTAGLMFGGNTPGAVQTTTESYNGTAWTEVNDLNAAQNAQGSAGTLTSGMSALGAQSPGANVEDWNGSTWSTNPHSLNSARQFPGGDGPSNDSAIMVGGEPAPNGALTEIYNGSSWTESGDLNTARNQLAAAGTTTALLAMGGNTGADAETFNGSAWTAVSDMNTGRGGLGGSGNSTAALAFAGGSPTAIGNTEAWNGSAWTEVNDLSTARRFFASSNIVTGNTSAYAASGLQSPPANLTTMEIWAFPPATAAIVQEGDMWFNSSSSALKGYGTAAGIPSTTWASGANINTARGIGVGVGKTTAGLIWGGYNGAQVTLTESYNGTAWTEVADLPTAVQVQARGGIGTQTAALSAGGEPSGNNQTESETWNGSSWAENTEMNSPHIKAGGAGSQTAGIVITTITPGNENVETWNGTSWTEVGNVNTKGGDGTGIGSQTAAIYFGGERPSASAKTESWDGTSWTEVNDLNTARYGIGGSGGQSLGMAAGGFTTDDVAVVESWNGTSWTEINDLANSRYGGLASGGAQSVSSAIDSFISGSYNPAFIASTEEFTATAAVATVTTS